MDYSCRPFLKSLLKNNHIGNPLCLILSLLVLTSLNSFSQTYEKREDGIKSSINGIDIQIQFYTPDIVRVIKAPAGRPFKKESLSVIKQDPAKLSLGVKDAGNLITINSGKLIVSLNTKSGAISYASGAGASLLKEKEERPSFAPFVDAGTPTFTVGQSFTLDKREAIYGLGQQQEGRMIQRNLSLRMIQGNTDDYVTFFQSAKGYGVFWDNYSPTTFTDTPEATSFKSDVGECIDYYFMFGGNADGVVACMRKLTGQVPMLPLWTYGYWQSRERYKSQNELVDVVKKYRALGVPLDGVIQDWQYWGNNYLWNAMDFLNPEFHDPKKMVDEVHNLNAHMIISIWNSFGPQTKQYRELNNINALMDFKTWPESGSEKFPPNPDYPSGVRVYDPYNPAARDIYWKYLNAGLFSVGLDGWWIDSSEPDHMQFVESDLDNKTYLGSFRKVRNAFPLMTVGGVYDHQRETNSDKRVFILTRSAFAGQQRYGSNTWSGDVVASWNALRNQISAGLNFSLCGIPYWNSDIGGFFLWEYPDRLNDADYRELYVRWLQFGTFCPMMRSHGTDAPREIYQFGSRGGKHYDAIEKFIKLRYRMLPYIYSTAWDVTANQSTMMRALVMDFPNDRNALDINDEFMLGRSILVNPVTQPMYIKREKNGKDEKRTEDFSVVKTKETYLAAGTSWIDFWTGEQISGGVKVARETPLDVIPLYVKAGAVIPFGPDVQYAEEKKWDNLEIRVYPGADGKFVLYEDENDNYNYEKGQYSTIAFTWDDKKKILTIGERNGSFPGMLENRKFNVVMVSKENSAGEKNMAGKQITYTGQQIKVQGF